MRVLIPLVAVSTLLFAIRSAEAAKTATAAEPPEGFIALFNGKNLDGWHAVPHFDPRKLAAMSEEDRKQKLDEWWADAKTHWRVDNGELVNDGKGPYLTTDASFGDCEILIEYKTVPKADSGIYLRGTPQVQIWDTTKEGGKWDRNADKGSGGLFNNSKGAPGQLPLVHADKPFGEWNKFRIVQVGSRTSVWMNDELVVDHAVMENYWDRSVPLFVTGPIQLQTHGGEIRWRNLFVRPIPPSEANAILRSKNSEDFVSIFNGRDFSGWKGPIENYQITDDGTLMCRPHKGGTIYTDDEYTDFAVRLEIKLPPAGNNGLAIRYPGAGDTAYVGMCELQVLDDTAPRYAKLDPRQAHGSAYGMVAAHRGFLRKTGEWNFEEVTVKGSTVKVELNGYVILDADLATVHEFLANREHPGKDRKSGHFGFAGHSDPVQFRNIRIKSLEAAGEK